MVCLVFSLLLVLLVTGGYAEQRKVPFPAEKMGMFLRVYANCIVESGTIWESLVVLKEGRMSDNNNFRKYVYCVFTSSGYSNKDGHIQEEKSLELFPESDRQIVKEQIVECNKNQEVDPVDKVSAFYKCFIEKSPVILTIKPVDETKYFKDLRTNLLQKVFS
ncbi:uncharacterized protein LOC128200214 [Galleria mellonella]|uniref:Uncharacterized protein LOC128200214 n=1 Tax=Galleria mellonella TaxID=7137 RepID=A0ABM3MCN8_GALME|nr:uncharacterized protein LOC128200214 [Galleria mellonella]